MYKKHPKKPVSYCPNESEADQAPLQHHVILIKLPVKIINGWKLSIFITKCSTLDASANLYPKREYELSGL